MANQGVSKTNEPMSKGSRALVKEWHVPLFRPPSRDSLTDEEIFHLADDIEFDENVESLGMALKFTRAEINRFTDTNQLFGRKSSKGSRDMLLSWRQKVKEQSQRVDLKKSLIQAGLRMLAEKYFPDVQYVNEGKSFEHIDSMIEMIYFFELVVGG